MSENQTGLEKWFNPGMLGGPVGGFTPPPLANLFGSDVSRVAKSTGNYKIFNCSRSSDCGSGFVCSAGECVNKDDSSKAGSNGGSGPATSAASGSGSPNCNPDEESTDCGDTKKNCPKPTCGTNGGKNGQNCEVQSRADCCGGIMYRCGGDAINGIPPAECPQCEPCEPPYRECKDVCDWYYKANGANSSAASCQNTDGSQRHCGNCQECFSGQCQDWSSAPCWCNAVGAECPDCEECDRDENSPTYGECAATTGTCKECTNCSVVCPCGTQVNCRACYEKYRNGLAAPSQCRADCYKKFCTDKQPLTHTKQPACPEEKDPCKADPGNSCEIECECITRYGPCGGERPPNPPGKRCTSQGYMSTCADDGSGEMVYFDRCCTMNTTDPKCDKCDCLCSNDCPDCYYCGANGECVYDEDCDRPCDEPCNGNCCGPGRTCKDAILYSTIDPCHNQPCIFAVPVGTTPELVWTEDISAEDAVCDRFHTHCHVKVNNQFVCTHWDCQKGLVVLGPAPYKVCG